MDKNQAKEAIKKLVSKYDQVSTSGKVRNYTEEETKNAFIKPLFESLGWDFEEKDEVSAEENIMSSGRVDYGFYINGRAKFYLEAKSLRADLNIEEFAKQAIKYSFNRGVTWAILTDFESVKVFNAQSPSEYLGDKLYFEIKYSDFLDRFDQLWLLSKEAMVEDLIDKEAERVGKKIQRIPVTEQLYKDLNNCREILINYLGKWNPEISKELLEEGVQKLIDRLIFIRVAEDRKIEDNILTPLINQWRTLTGSNKPRLYQSMAKKFRELDEIYNSDLFTPHPFENWEDDGGGLEQVIKRLHGKYGYYEYDFSVIPADILGSVYENYLGYKLSQSKKGLTLDKAAGKRKEQGIYYTPRFIVDYIVRNALKPILDNCKSVNELKKIKVLDPACGSGSFLIKALEVINEKYKEFGYAGDELTKIQILQENIYGVDLDQQVVEIARLNLLINALEERGKLPSLENNIKNGNSLISGTDEELERFFGKNFIDKKPFNWEEEFPDVFAQGGFDMVIGNPPYVQLSMEKGLPLGLKEYLIETYKSSMGRLNTFGFFIRRGIDLLKDNGYLGFIVPNTLLTQDYYEELRRYILENSAIKSIATFESLPFKDAVIENIVLVLGKSTSKDSNKVTIYRVSENLSFIREKFIAQHQFVHSPKGSFNISIGGNEDYLREKIEENTTPLSAYLNVNQAIALRHDRSKWVSNQNMGSNYKQLLVGGRNINRYMIRWDGSFLKYDSSGIHSGGDEKKFLAKEKIFFRRVSTHLVGALDIDQYYGLHTLVAMTKKKGVPLDIRYLLALFNSKLLNFYYRSVFASTKKVFSEIGARQVAQLPIKKIDLSNQEDKKRHDHIVLLVKKITELNRELERIEIDSEKWKKTKNDIERTDKQIDQMVYKLYGLTPAEIAIVEGKN